MEQAILANDKPRIGITLGDINGVGPEVVIKALNNQVLTRSFTPIVYGTSRVLSYYRKMLNISEFNYNQINTADQAQSKRVNVVNCWDGLVEIHAGQETPEGGKCSLLALERATADLKSGQIDAMVTAPISKNNIQSDDFHFPGHTEYITEKVGAKESLMMMVADEVRIGVATGHLPLQQVPTALSAELLKTKIQLFLKSLVKDFRINKPKLAVLGLNPHAGENGLLGNEERDIYLPVIQEFRQAGQQVYGLFAADGFLEPCSSKLLTGSWPCIMIRAWCPSKPWLLSKG